MCAFFIQGVPTKKEEPLEISTAQPHGMLESIRVLFFPRYKGKDCDKSVGEAGGQTWILKSPANLAPSLTYTYKDKTELQSSKPYSRYFEWFLYF